MCCSAVNDGSCSPWVMCSCSVVRGNQIRDTYISSKFLQFLHSGWLCHDVNNHFLSGTILKDYLAIIYSFPYKMVLDVFALAPLPTEWV